jgi:hypothetical protein
MTELSEYDFLELVAFDSKVEIEGFGYAASEYAPRFEHDNFVPMTNRAELSQLLREYRDRLDAFWDQPDCCDLHNKHVDEARKRAADSARPHRRGAS